MRRKNKIAAAVCIIVSMLIVASFVFVIFGVHHDCTGEECPVCLEIKLCNTILRSFSAGACVISAIVLPVFLTRVVRASFYCTTHERLTPVTLCVKLSD